jgi:hypothetical protein
VAGRGALKLALLALAVVLAHFTALEWIGRQADAISGLSELAPPMYTRLLMPVAPAPMKAAVAAPEPRPRARIAPQPRPAASAAQEKKAAAEESVAAAPVEEARAAPVQQTRVAPPETEPSDAAAVAEAAAQPASAPASAPSVPAAGTTPDAQAALAHWPLDSRLSYRLSGHWRGPLYGDARVQWQRAGADYQVRLEVDLGLLGSQVLTSQGEVTPHALQPRIYEELRPGKRRVARIGDEVVTLDNGRTLPRPPGVQDTASQFVELSQRFASGKATLEVGRSVTVWLARPGGVDRWVYDVVAREAIAVPRMGEVEAFHLKPRMIANPRGNITAEMWFAPSLQYLPVRIKVIMGEEAWLDLVVEKIEQR